MSKTAGNCEIGYSLGIDLGTTSIKVAVVRCDSGELVACETAVTQADVDLADGKKSEQDVSKIFACLNQLMRKFSQELLEQVRYVGVSGQMHGVVLWNPNAWSWNHEDFAITNTGAVSNLITWQDQRCDQEFLNSIPPVELLQQFHTGYGMATLLWLNRFEAAELKKYLQCGTIQDLLVSILIGSSDNVVMSDQNAGSWGLFDHLRQSWNEEVVDAFSFPVHILPKVKHAGETAGQLIANWIGIPKGCTVGIALGDAQASVLSILHGKKTENSAVLNISTSIQLTMVMPANTDLQSDLKKLAGTGVEYRPYFNNSYVAMGSGLNGGNCLAYFVSTLKSWVSTLSHEEVSEDKIWKVLLSEGSSQKETTLIIRPTLRGERFIPTITASVENLTVSNSSLGDFMRSLCSGIIQNMHIVFPMSLLQAYELKRIYATGSALLRNKILQEEVLKGYPNCEVEFCNEGDSAYGAAVLGLIQNEAVTAR